MLFGFGPFEVQEPMADEHVTLERSKHLHFSDKISTLVDSLVESSGLKIAGAPMELETAKKRCQAIIHRVTNLSKISPSSKPTLLRLAHSELSFLSDCTGAPPLSLNVGHLEAVVYILLQPFLTAVSRVCKLIPLAGDDSVHVDIVCTLTPSHNPAWIIVSDRNPNYVSWNSCGKSKGLSSRIRQLLHAARGDRTLGPSSILLFFSNGLPEFLRQKLRDEFGALEPELKFSVLDFDFCEESENGWVNVVGRSFREACLFDIKVDHSKTTIPNSSHALAGSVWNVPQLGDADGHLGDSFCSLLSVMKTDTGHELVNLDTTALVAAVSGITNGHAKELLATPWVELQGRFEGNTKFVIDQATSEIQSPLHKELGAFLSGKRGMVCGSVLSEFETLVKMWGGPHEKHRATRLLKCLMIVADSPSERMASLPTTRKLALKSKIVFGTGDYWHAPTLTANTAFVRAVAQIGLSLFTIEHRPRALTGN